MQKLAAILEKLRSENGCPWDKEQTHSSLKRNLIEESYELLEAIDNNNLENMKEELGDVLLQVFFHAQIAKENAQFSIEDVAQEICTKLIRRHPHVFGDENIDNADDVITRWEEIKKIEKKDTRQSALSGVVKAQPSLMVAHQLSKKAVKTGFEWPNYEMLKECFYSEVDEFHEAMDSGDISHMEEELGDMLFALVNIARWNKIDSEQALRRANDKFIKRFEMMEKLAQKPLEEYNFKEYDDLWKQAKQKIAKGDF
ncbi:MAG: nucleoside triphosphate pyrophosphohydrolase [Candidatus Gastranaerophilales bacterium]|nr:nucleoside triphosphate pyrophosphohydrolase [Candidatus Gastranaerophilales bacterium]